MKQTAIPAITIALAIALAIFGCSGHVEDGAPPPASGCAADADCPADFVCESGACSYDPPECTVNADCADPQICVNGNCGTPCQAGCPAGFACNSATGICDTSSAAGGSGGGSAGGTGGGSAGGMGGGTAGGSGGGAAGGSGGGSGGGAAGGSGGGAAGGTGGGSGGGGTSTCTDTWTNFAQASFSANCVSCHSHNHSAYANYSSVYSDRSKIKSEISSGSMPEGGWSTSSADKARILTWLGCGAPQ